MQPAIHPTPWYRQFWPWFIMALPASAVIAGITTVIIATQNRDSLVADDYYKEGLAINQSIERDQAASRLGLQALMRVNADNEQVVVELSFTNQIQYPDELTLSLTHPTLDPLDQQASLIHQGEGRYLAEKIKIPAGDWNIMIEPNNQAWRLTQRANITLDGQILLSAQQ